MVCFKLCLRTFLGQYLDNLAFFLFSSLCTHRRDIRRIVHELVKLIQKYYTLSHSKKELIYPIFRDYTSFNRNFYLRIIEMPNL